MPSGLDTATGAIHDPSIQATATLTLALPKEGLRASSVGAAVGELYVSDIGVPPGLYARLGFQHTVDAIFARDDIIRLS